MKKSLVILFLCLFLISFVSAGFFSDVWKQINGKIVEDYGGCVTEGKFIPSPPECCGGLKLIKPKFEDVVGILGICTAKCGNGVCDTETESEYNCPEDCGELVETSCFYLLYHSGKYDHFYTISENEKDNAVSTLGYTYKGIAGYIYQKQQPQTVPFYYLYNSRIYNHLYTINENEKDNAVNKCGYTYKGIAGYIYQKQQPNTTPFYRLYHSGKYDHFYTISEDEKDNAVSTLGYTYEGIAGHVYPQPFIAQTCSQLGGNICSSTQVCSGSWIDASDSERCCSGTCEEPTCTLCDTCGEGFWNVCDRAECYACTNEDCYFLNRLIINECNSCTDTTCEDYDDDSTTCNDDPCGLGNCIWEGVSCVSSENCRDESHPCTPEDTPCCYGLKEVGLCFEEDGGCACANCGSICRPCGNGVCNTNENRCNCPEDCGIQQQTCAQLGGAICSTLQTCSGEWLDASDSDRCCNGVCEIITSSLYYVSPDGNDNNMGTLANPFKTIEKARDAVRTVNTNMNENIIVYLRGGTYEPEDTIVFTQEDSGTNNHYVIYKNYQNEIPIISGGERIYRWRIHDAQKNIWKAKVESTAKLNLFLEDLDSRQLYVNGKRAVRAKTENNLESVTITDNGLIIWDNLGFQISDLEGAELVQTFCWKNFRCGIESVSGNELIISSACFDSIKTDYDSLPHCQKNTKYFVENSYVLLSSPGEWYYSKIDKTMYYIPRNGEDMNSAVAIAPILETLIKGEESLHHLKFEGLTFAYATWNAPSEELGGRCAQADVYGLHGSTPNILANVGFDFVEEIYFENNVFTHLGGTGLSFRDGTDYSTVKGNLFKDISASGVRMGGIYNCDHEGDGCATEDNVIENNLITDVANEYFSSVGIMVGYARRTNVNHNTIYGLPYTGIHNGWGWGMIDPTYAGDNLLQNNYIYDNMQLLHDGGGIYTLSAQPGSVFSGNVITGHKNSEPADSTGGALYLDKASRYLEIYNNVIFDNEIRTIVIKGGDHNIHDNYWQDRGIFSVGIEDIRFIQNDECGKDVCGPITMENNHVITSLSQASSSIINNAGITNDFSVDKDIVVIGHEEKPIWGQRSDFDGDGKEDILKIYQKSLNWFVDSSLRGKEELWFSMTFGVGKKTLVADMNGDGKDDVVLIVKTSTGWKWHYVKSTGKSFVPIKDALLGQDDGKNVCVLDYDNDGRDEIIVENETENKCIDFNPTTNKFMINSCEKGC